MVLYSSHSNVIYYFMFLMYLVHGFFCFFLLSLMMYLGCHCFMYVFMFYSLFYFDKLQRSHGTSITWRLSRLKFSPTMTQAMYCADSEGAVMVTAPLEALTNTLIWEYFFIWKLSFFHSFFLGFRRPSPITGRSGWQTPISHLGPKNLSRTRGPEHYLVYGRPKQILYLVGKTNHNNGGLECILGLTNFHNQSS